MADTEMADTERGSPARSPDPSPATADAQAPAHESRASSPAPPHGSQASTRLPERLEVAPGHVGHGNSVAAWTAVAIIMIAALVMSIAVVAGTTWLFVAGVVIAVLGLITGKVLATMGFGVNGRQQH